MRQRRWAEQNAALRLAVAGWVVAAALGWRAMAAAAGTEGAAAPDGVRVKLQHVVLTATGERLAVLEVWNVENTGARPADLDVPLPVPAADLVVRDGFEGRVVPFETTAKGFRVSGWMEPGEQVVSFAYTLKLEHTLKLDESPVLRWARPVPYPVRELVVMVEDGKLDLRSAGLEELGTAQLGDRKFHLFGATDLKPGAEVTFDVVPVAGGVVPAGGGAPIARDETGQTGQAGSPQEHVITTSFHGGNANVQLWQRSTGLSGHGGLFGIFLLSVLAVVVLYGGFKLVAAGRTRKGVLTTAQGVVCAAADADLQAATQEEIQQLIRQIADLDRRRAAGALEEAVYAESRAKLKRRLVEAMRRLQSI